MITHQIHRSRLIVVSTWTGEVSDSMHLEAYRSLYEDDGWKPGMSELADIRLANPAGITGAGLRAVARLTARASEGGPEFRTAVLVNSMLAFGLTRMYQVFSEDSLENVRIFEDASLALEWIGAPDDLLG